MKNTLTRILAGLALGTSATLAVAQGTAFTYQGRLNDGDSLANGLYDIQFGAYDAVTDGNRVGGLVTNNAVAVSNGLFTTTLDFGAGVFTGPSLWLDIAVSTNGAGTFAAVTPRQPIAPCPYAIFSASAGTAASATLAQGILAGGVSAPGLNTAGAPAAGQVLAFNGTQLVWQDPVIGGNTGGWAVTGNVGTTAGVNFLGTLDLQPLEFKVAGTRALRLEPTASGNPNIIGGNPSNLASNGVTGAVIGGGMNNLAGGSYSTIGGGYANNATKDFTSVLGGIANSATGLYDSVAGGNGNVSSGNNLTSAWILNGPSILDLQGCSAVGGGFANLAGGTCATVPGGAYNIASGDFTFAAGTGAYAAHNGSFVWADNSPFYPYFSTITINQFLIRASGGVGIGTAQTPPGGLRVGSGGLAVTGASSPNYPGAVGVFVEKLATAGAVFGFDYTSGHPLSLALNSPGGNVGIGTTSPAAKLTVYDSGSVSHRVETGGAVNAWARIEFANANGQWNVGTSRGYNGDQLYFNRQGSSVNALALQPGGDATFGGNVSVCTVTIRGGCDLAEPFATTSGEAEKGAVMVIDPAHPGKLKLSDHAYDKRVAGVISGANGVNPGIALHQEGLLDEGQNVALSGRVYVLAEASSGPIEPGDLLTTSSTPGYAMKASDPARAQGAVLGKAMTGLAQGTGTVLVLVTLQ